MPPHEAIVSAGGLEPPTLCLKGRCSTPELRARQLRDAKNTKKPPHPQLERPKRRQREQRKMNAEERRSRDTQRKIFR